MKQVPLTEKILAQSALYSRAIQKQQKHNSPAASFPAATLNAVDAAERARLVAAVQQPQQHQVIPQLTYSQLQQQQQQQIFTRQLLNHNPEGHKDSSDNNTKDRNPATEPHSLTAVELPAGSPQTRPEEHATGKEANGSRQIMTIPKPDPLENPLK